EQLGRDRFVAQLHERVMHQRMIHDVERHALHYTRYNSCLMKRFAAALLAALSTAVALSAQAPRRVSLVVIGRAVITENPSHQILTPGAVAVDGDTIVAVDSPAAMDRFAAAETIRVPDEIILPGLINTHTHAPMVMYRGLADDLALMEWLNRYIFPA